MAIKSVFNTPHTINSKIIVIFTKNPIFTDREQTNRRTEVHLEPCKYHASPDTMW